jgi:hypothetical protein
MTAAVGAPAFTSRPSGRWPGRPLLTSRLREILRREFNAADAWIVHANRRCRLEARVGWQVVVLLEDGEETFWAPFYTAAVRNRRVGGMLVAALEPTQRPRHELSAILRPLWDGATLSRSP